MAQERRTPPDEILIKLYVDEGWGTTRIGKEFGITPKVVARHLKRLGVLDSSRQKVVDSSATKEAIRLRVEDRLSLSEICQRSSLSKATLSVLLKDYPLTDEEIISKKVDASRVSAEKQRQSSPTKLPLLKEGVLPIPEEIPSYKRGLIGEAFVTYVFLRHGIKISHPPVLEQACDLFVHGKSGRVYQCEVKSSTSNSVCVTRTKFFPKGGYRVQSYSAEEGIDFFICVLLNREEIFIIPYSELGGSTNLSLGGDGKFTVFKDRFDLFE